MSNATTGHTRGALAVDFLFSSHYYSMLCREGGFFDSDASLSTQSASNSPNVILNELHLGQKLFSDGNKGNSGFPTGCMTTCARQV
jgi:hypothetical protein